MYMIHARHTNDTNGNPRRLYVLYNAFGAIVAAFDEGYKGTYAVPTEWREMAAHAPTIDVTPTQYKFFKTMMKELNDK